MLEVQSSFVDAARAAGVRHVVKLESVVSRAVETLLGRPATTFDAFAVRHAAIFRGEAPAPKIRGGAMKSFLIKYTFALDAAAADAWHARVREFIAAIENDAELSGRISYRCLKARAGNDYYHLAQVTDDRAPDELAQRDWFKSYTAETKRVAGGTVTVVPLEVLAATRKA